MKYVVNVDNLIHEGTTYEVEMPTLGAAFLLLAKYVDLPFRLRLRRLPR